MKETLAVIVAIHWVMGCGGGGETATEQGASGTSGGEQTAPRANAPDGGAARAEEPPAPTDPGAASLDEPPPPNPTTPTTLVGREGVPAEGIVREEPRPEGGVRLAVALPSAADGNAVFEIQTTPARSGGLAIFALRAVHPAATWASCSALSLSIDRRNVALPDVRVLAETSAAGVVETARATAEIRVARRLAAAHAFHVSACGESFEPPAAARPILARFVARYDELASAPAAAAGASPTH